MISDKDYAKSEKERIIHEIDRHIDNMDYKPLDYYGDGVEWACVRLRDVYAIMQRIMEKDDD